MTTGASVDYFRLEIETDERIIVQPRTSVKGQHFRGSRLADCEQINLVDFLRTEIARYRTSRRRSARSKANRWSWSTVASLTKENSRRSDPTICSEYSIDLRVRPQAFERWPRQGVSSTNLPSRATANSGKISSIPRPHSCTIQKA
jgi:hypothetical protein